MTTRKMNAVMTPSMGDDREYPIVLIGCIVLAGFIEVFLWSF